MTAGGWTRYEVAIPVPVPAGIDAVWLEVLSDPDQHRVVRIDDHHLLLLRSTIAVRTNDPEPAVTAGQRAINWWNSRLYGSDLPERFTGLAWAWKADQ